ncbi:MAG: FHA domain-containing protein [Gomphosphaeria aponina SAG 52.96 = DSM 107014]|uniref:FHA domain-containing protein n=1 Tax=Gomphosphaeria aponina SAG 52.96 = DSM 107014 TaxID=1521640 RepID=A0A941JRF4_9CHRO|nr:FHA domain-containing protein [Gomphosphaeria aponina SAG 52.96 = DSM 107014]
MNNQKYNLDHVLLVEDDKGKTEFFLTENIYSIGRAPKRDIRIYSPFVSRYHATLLRHQNEQSNVYYEIIDGDPMGSMLSSNGLMINGHQVYSHQLKHGDKIVFGPAVFAIYHNLHRLVSRSNLNEEEVDTLIIDKEMKKIRSNE